MEGRPRTGANLDQVVNVCMDQHSPVPFHLDDFTRYMERFAGAELFLSLSSAFADTARFCEISFFLKSIVRICENSCSAPIHD